MREIACVIELGLRKLCGLARVMNVCAVVSYHMARYVVFGDYDQRMVDIIRSLSEINPLYVKVFQAVSGTSGILSPVVEEYLLRFSDDVPYGLSDNVERRRHIESVADYMRQQNPSLLLTDVSHEPIHSGTVSLVYGAKLDGRDVVVKCVRSGINAKMREAIDDANSVISVMNLLPSVMNMRLDCVLKENENLLVEQTSMRNELDNLNRVREKLHCRDYVVTPRPYSEFTECDDGMLVMERLYGKRVDEVTSDEKEEYGILLARQSLDAIVSDGVYHSDLHRGNILFMESEYEDNCCDGDTNDGESDDNNSSNDGSNNSGSGIEVTKKGVRTVKKLGLLDFGIVGYLSEAEQLTLSSFYLSLGMKNYEDVVNVLLGTLTNGDALQRMDNDRRDEIVERLVRLTEDACTSRDGFGPRHMREINEVFSRNGLFLAPIFCRIEMALAMNVSVSKALETKNRNFMSYIQQVIESKMDLTVYDV